MNCPPSASMFMIRAPFPRAIGTDYAERRKGSDSFARTMSQCRHPVHSDFDLRHGCTLRSKTGTKVGNSG
jgi:hypothetical protein